MKMKNQKRTKLRQLKRLLQRTKISYLMNNVLSNRSLMMKNKNINLKNRQRRFHSKITFNLNKLNSIRQKLCQKWQKKNNLPQILKSKDYLPLKKRQIQITMIYFFRYNLLFMNKMNIYEV